MTGTSLERERQVHLHPLKFENVCTASILKTGYMSWGWPVSILSCFNMYSVEKFCFINPLHLLRIRRSSKNFFYLFSSLKPISDTYFCKILCSKFHKYPNYLSSSQFDFSCTNIIKMFKIMSQLMNMKS